MASSGDSVRSVMTEPLELHDEDVFVANLEDPAKKYAAITKKLPASKPGVPPTIEESVEAPVEFCGSKLMYFAICWCAICAVVIVVVVINTTGSDDKAAVVPTMAPTIDMVPTPAVTLAPFVTEAPAVTDAPIVTEVPVTTDAPTTGVVATEAPTATATVVTEAPTIAPVATEAPTMAPVATDAPTTAPVATDAPTTAPVATDAPTTAPVATEAPTTAPVATDAPTAGVVVTEAPTAGVVATGAPTEGLVATGAPTAGVVATGAPTEGVVETGVPTGGVAVATNAPTDPVQSDPVDLRAVIPQYSQDALLDPTSPQSRAFLFVNFDPFVATRTEAEMIQRFALATLYFGLGSSAWTAGSVNPAGDECDWFADTGSLCDTNEMMQSLLLENNGLIGGPIPPEVGLLTSLVDLDMSMNALTGSIPTYLGQLTNLGTLNLAKNELTGTIPTELSALPSLTVLDLTGLDLVTGVVPAEICDVATFDCRPEDLCGCDCACAAA